MTSSPPPRRLSGRFYLPAALFVVAGVERVVAGTRGPPWLLWFGVALVLAGVALAIVIARGRSRG
ncbi:MAG: cytochrome c-type biogenesis protein CcmH [Actinomycetota bacterium]|nr:cytochrome c-type biogenesis protein CcmH [Actinomycetota bacterium]